MKIDFSALDAALLELPDAPWQVRRYGIYTVRDDCRLERRVIDFDEVPLSPEFASAIVALRNAYAQLRTETEEQE